MGHQLHRPSSLKTLDITAIIRCTFCRNLVGNNLSRVFPYSKAAMKSLRYLDLSFNKLSQGIPPGFRSLSKLPVLHLQNNQLSGPLNVIYSLPIKDLNIENDNFTRLRSPHLSDSIFKIGGNNLSPALGPLPPLYQAPPSYQASSLPQKEVGHTSDGLHTKAPATKHFSPNIKNKSGSKKGLSDGAIVSIPLGSIILVLVVAFSVTCYFWRSSKNSNESNGNTVSHDSSTSIVQMSEESIGRVSTCKDYKDSSKIIVQQVHGLMSQATGTC